MFWHENDWNFACEGHGAPPTGWRCRKEMSGGEGQSTHTLRTAFSGLGSTRTRAWSNDEREERAAYISTRVRARSRCGVAKTDRGQGRRRGLRRRLRKDGGLGGEEEGRGERERKREGWRIYYYCRKEGRVAIVMYLSLWAMGFTFWFLQPFPSPSIYRRLPRVIPVVASHFFSLAYSLVV